MAKFRVQPPIEYRPVFYMGMRRQKCRYNPSFERFMKLPDVVKTDVVARYQERNPKTRLPDFKLSVPEKKAKKEKKP